MASEAISQSLRDSALQVLQFRIGKLDGLAGALVDEMVMMIAGRLEMPNAGAKGLPFDNARGFKPPECPIDRRHRHIRNALAHFFEQLLRIGMADYGQRPCDRSPGSVMRMPLSLQSASSGSASLSGDEVIEQLHV